MYVVTVATYVVQGLIDYFTKDGWITPSTQILRRKVVFDVPTDDAIAELCVVDKFVDSKIIKLLHDRIVSYNLLLSYCSVYYI